MAKNQVILTNEERETVIMGNAACQEWDIVSADPRIIRKIERAGWKAEADLDPWGAKRFKIPLPRLSFRRPVSDKDRERGKALAAKRV